MLEDGTLLLSRRAAVMEQLGLDRQEAHEEPVAPAQVEVGSILRYLFLHGSVVTTLSVFTNEYCRRAMLAFGLPMASIFS